MKTWHTLIGFVLVVCAVNWSGATSFYVNPLNGNNQWDGRSPIYTSGNHGPKATIQSAANAASSLDTLNLLEFSYDESVSINKSLQICCPGTSRIQNLTVRNNSQVSVSSTLEISGTLTLTSGVITTSRYCTILVTNESPNAVQITNGSINGTITRTIDLYSTQSYLFTDNNMRITLDGADTPDGPACTAVVSVFSAQGQQPPFFTEWQAINRYYQITSDPPIQATLRLAYSELELNGILESNLTSFYWTQNDSSWVPAGGVLDPTNNYTELSGVSLGALSKWTLGDPSHPLPIQLASFTAVVNSSNDVDLTWITLSETNNYGFFIQQRNVSYSNFTDVPNSFVPGHGTTIEPHTYVWVHQGVAAGTYYYRLKQVDLDGTIQYSDARQVHVLSPAGVAESYPPAVLHLAQNYPNPFNPSTQIQFTVDIAGFTILTVSDVLGKEVEELYDGIAEPGKVYVVRFNASRLSNGTYFYTLVNVGQTSRQKMLLLK